MDATSAATQKVQAVLAAVRNLAAGDFPHSDTKDVLAAIEALFSQHEQTLVGLANAPTAAPIYCQAVLQSLADYLPILGFIHRSKHASNAFEIYGPLQRLARQLLSDDTKVVVSSEWEFSPFTMIGIEELPSVVLVGLPASECANALLAPLAGHELGHSLWNRECCSDLYEPAVTKAVLEAITNAWVEFAPLFNASGDAATFLTQSTSQQTWATSVFWSLRQCEEAFCDLVGLRMFGESYLHALSYLVAPGFDAERIVNYPSDRQRVGFLMRGANRFGVEVPNDYASLFIEPKLPDSPQRAMRLQIADAATNALIGAIIEHVDSSVAKAGIALPASDDIEQISHEFDLFTPASNPRSLAAIINAGWRAEHSTGLWSHYPQLCSGTERHRHLNELVLKSAQVLEINQRVGNP